jgi:hypothetical protein
VTGPWHLELGVELGADDGVQGVIVDLQMMGLLDPLVQRFIGGETGGLPEGLLDRGWHIREE